MNSAYNRGKVQYSSEIVLDFLCPFFLLTATLFMCRFQQFDLTNSSCDRFFVPLLRFFLDH